MSKLKARELAPPLVALILGTFLILALVPWVSQGPNPTYTVLPTGQISWKMSLTAHYTDNTNETIFEKGGLPGLGQMNWIRVNGVPKDVKDLTADAMAGVATSAPMPSDGNAHFKLNFTAWVGGGAMQLKARSLVDTVDSPFKVVNNTVALVVLPSMVVNGSDIFTPGEMATATNRTVVWTLNSTVTITAPTTYPTFTLTLNGYDSSAASFSSGTITACTDCSNPNPIGGGTTTVSGGKGSATFDADPCIAKNAPAWCTQPPSAAECAAIPGMAGCTETKTSETKPPSITAGYVSETSAAITHPPIYSQVVNVNSAGDETVDTFSTDPKTGTTTKTTTTIKEVTSADETPDYTTQYSATNKGSYGIRPGQSGVALDWLWQFDAGNVTYRLDVWTVLKSLGISAVLVSLFSAGYFIALHRSRSKPRKR